MNEPQPHIFVQIFALCISRQWGSKLYTSFEEFNK